MKTPPKLNLIAAALVGALAFTTAQAQQVPLPTTAAEVPGPASGTAMTKEYVPGPIRSHPEGACAMALQPSSVSRPLMS
jgi:hypothetical protein